MTDKDLAAIRERCDAATQGPWQMNEEDQTVVETCTGKEFIVADFSMDGWDETLLDAAFIAHARTDIPALLDEIARLTKERDALLDFAKKAATDYTECDKMFIHVSHLKAQYTLDGENGGLTPLGRMERNDV